MVPHVSLQLEQDAAEEGTDENPTPWPDGEERVKLFRAVAKLELDLSRIAKDVTSVRYYHANRQFNLVWDSKYVPENNPAYYNGDGKNYISSPDCRLISLLFAEMLIRKIRVWLDAA